MGWEHWGDLHREVGGEVLEEMRQAECEECGIEKENFARDGIVLNLRSKC